MTFKKYEDRLRKYIILYIMYEQELNELKDNLIHCFDNFQKFANMLAPSNAHPDMLNHISVKDNNYEVNLRSIAVVNNMGQRALSVRPFELSKKDIIIKAITKYALGTLREEKDEIILQLSPITAEYLQTLLKKLKEEAEKNRIIMRQLRQNTRKIIDKIKKTNENEYNKLDKKVQGYLDECISKIDEIVKKFEHKIKS